MESNKKRFRRRRLAAVVLLVAVAIWIGGCASGASMGLSAFLPSKEKGTVVEEHPLGGSGDGKTEGTTAGFEPGEDTNVLIPGLNENESEGLNNGNNKNGHNGGGETNGIDGNNGIVGNHNHNGNNGHHGNGDDKGHKPDSNGGLNHHGKKEKLVALTFDDGPDPNYTTAILDILKEKGVKATFFVVGTQVEKYPDIMKRIHEEGHEIGNHSQHHKDLRKLSSREIENQIKETDRAIQQVLGFSTNLFRAPYGALSDKVKKVMSDMGQHHVLWTVDTKDWAGTSVSDMRAMIRNETKPNGIILMHSFGGKHISNTVKMLPGAIDDLHEMGYEMVPVGQIVE
ncbi:polysaccharide deacetylase family protein [Paenibacillus sp. GCM10027627]|uniref:polysaccharide deacetylase family protein n=1 Tax=unclassified Paenibacillus TaxID=185978 RepID=UPI00362DF7BF